MTNCWEWKGGRSNRRYGHVSINGERILAHRYSYELYKGHIPPSMVVCHSCDNTFCLNPGHLWLGTQKDNLQDCKSKGRLTQRPTRAAVETSAARNKAKTHCIHGHEYTEYNTQRFKNGQGYLTRRCRTCSVERTRNYRLAVKEQINDQFIYTLEAFGLK